MKLNIDYICNTVYKNNKLDFIITEEGRIKKLENNTLRNELLKKIKKQILWSFFILFDFSDF